MLSSSLLQIVTPVDPYAFLSALQRWFSPKRDTDSKSAQPLQRDAFPSTAKDEALVCSPCMPVTGSLCRRTPDLTVQLYAAKGAIASMTSRMAVLAEEKDDALTRANTLENVKESWAVRERALVSTIRSLKSSNKVPGDVTGLRARLQETESMLAHQITVRTKLEDELTRYREIAQSQQDELYGLRVSTRLPLCLRSPRLNCCSRGKQRNAYTNRPSRSRPSRATSWRCKNESASLHCLRRDERCSGSGRRSRSSMSTWASHLAQPQAAVSSINSTRNPLATLVLPISPTTFYLDLPRNLSLSISIPILLDLEFLDAHLALSPRFVYLSDRLIVQFPYRLDISSHLSHLSVSMRLYHNIFSTN